MAQSLSEEEIQEILDTYDDLGNMGKVAEELDRSKGTVQKYLHRRHPNFDHKEDNIHHEPEEPELEAGTPDDGHPMSASPEDSAADESDEAEEDFTAAPPSSATQTGAPPTDEDDDEPDFESMDEGDFIEWFFSLPGHGVKEGFRDRLAQTCRVRDQLPDEKRLTHMLVNQASGIGNSNDAQMVAETYEVVKEQYMEAHGQGTQHASGMPGGFDGTAQQQPGRPAWPQTPGTAGGQSAGEWESVPGGAPPRGPPQGGGQPGGGQQPGVGPAGGSTQNGRGQQGSPGQAGQAQPQGGQSGGYNPEVEQLRQELQELRGEISRAAQAQGGDPDSDLKEALNDLVEIQEAMESLQGRDGGDADSDAVELLRSELDSLRSQLASETGDSSGGSAGGVGELARLAANNDVDSETLSTLADAFGVTDPEVKKAEYEFKAAERKSEARRDMIDAFFKNLQQTSGDSWSTILRIVENITAPSPAPQAAHGQAVQQAGAGQAQPQAGGAGQQGMGAQGGEPSAAGGASAGGGASSSRTRDRVRDRVEAVEDDTAEVAAEEAMEGDESAGTLSVADEPDEDDGEPEEDPSEWSVARITAEFDTSSYNAFSSDCMSYTGGDGSVCGELWRKVQEARIDEAPA